MFGDRQMQPRLRSIPLYSTIASALSSSSSHRSRHLRLPTITPPTVPQHLQSPPSVTSVVSNYTVKLVEPSMVSGLPSHPVRGLSFAVMALIVVASLCAVVGAIYMLIYFKSIKPMSARSRSYKDSGGGDDDSSRSKSAHPFFRHK